MKRKFRKRRLIVPSRKEANGMTIKQYVQMFDKLNFLVRGTTVVYGEWV